MPKEKEPVYSNDNQSILIWKCCKKYTLQTTDPKIAKTIRDWKFSFALGEGLNCRLWLFSVPTKKIHWICNKLGLPPPPKSPGRVKYGKSRTPYLNKGAHSPSKNYKKALIEPKN